MRRAPRATVLLFFASVLFPRPADADRDGAPAASTEPAGASSIPGYAPTGHRYRLSARLDPETKRVEGEVQIEWVNRSVEPASELWLHLYMNAFSSRDTVFMRESGARLRGEQYRSPGSIHLEELTDGNGRDLLEHAEDEVIPEDRTQMRVPLPEAVMPGEAIELHARFVTVLPALFARSGYHDGYFFVGQWFPKVARRERDGRWASFPYRGLGEFYADFADYHAELDLPADHRFASTGVERRRTALADGWIRHVVHAPAVHDFAFVSSRELLSSERRCAGVRVRATFARGASSAAERAAEVTCIGLARFGRLFGPYPYEELDVIVPPRGGEGSAGMEYPTLFVTEATWHAVDFGGVRSLTSTTAHELAHQWFQGLVATNEVQNPMLDEGISSWATWDLVTRIREIELRASALFTPDPFDAVRLWALDPKDPPPSSSVTSFSKGAYARSVYGRVPLIFETVARTFGRRRLIEAIGDYARSYRFEHPTPDDLYRVFDRHYPTGFSERVLRPALEEGLLSRVDLEREGDRLVVTRPSGDLHLPISVVVEGPSGRAVTTLRRGVDRWEAELPNEQRALGVIVDPTPRNLLDPQRLDGHRPAPHPFDVGWVGRLLPILTALMSGAGP